MTAQMFEEVNLVTNGLGTIELVHSDTDVHNPPTTYGYWLGARPQFGGSPNLLYSERLRASVPGSRVTPRLHRGRDVMIPVVVRVGKPEELPGAVNELLVTIDPVAAATYSTQKVSSIVHHLTTIEVLRAEAGSTTHEIDGYLIAGASEHQWRYDSDVSVVLPLVFRCPFPYWRKGSPVSDSHTLTTGTGTSAGDLRIAATASDVPMWPVFEFEITAANKTTGSMSIDQDKFQQIDSAFMEDSYTVLSTFEYVTRPDIRSAIHTLGSTNDVLADMFTPSPVPAGVQLDWSVVNSTDATIETTITIQPLSLTV